MVATGSLMGREMTPFPDTPHKPDPNSFSSIRNRVMTAETPDNRVELTSGEIHDNLKTCACDVTCVPAWCDYATTLCWRSLPLQNTEPQHIVFTLEKLDHYDLRSMASQRQTGRPCFQTLGLLEWWRIDLNRERTIRLKIW
jgi:hypothetical protein